MTRRPDLGLALAGAGLVVIIAAVAAGLVAVGGPGAARSEKIDAQMMERMINVADATSCQIANGGEAPASLTELMTKPLAARPADEQKAFCPGFDASLLAKPGIDYERIDATHIRLCADFQRPFDPERPGDRRNIHEELRTARPAGRRCYDLNVGDY